MPVSTLPRPVPAQQRLADLRARAQQAFQGAEEEKAKEQIQQTEQEAQIQRYAKMASIPRRKADNNVVTPNRSKPKNRTKSPSPPQDRSSPAESTKGVKFRPIQDVLHRLRWDESYDQSQYVVGYLERFEGILEMPAENFVRLSDDYSDEDWIPLHRVRYVKCRRVDGEDEVVWDRDHKIDVIFGSGKTTSSFAHQDTGSRLDVLSMDGTGVSGGAELR